MSGLTNYSEELLLKWLLTASAATRPTSVYVALHTADPTETGAVSEVTTGMDSAYVRKQVAFSDPVSGSGQVASNATYAVSWTSNGTYTVTHISLWDASTSGNCLFKGSLPVARSLVPTNVLSFTTGDIIAALD